jgi:hypothetical protein
MKTTQIPIKPRPGSLDQACLRDRLRREDRDAAGFPPRTEQSRIQWPTAEELQRISSTLAEVSRTGMRQEDAGDYFNSGDLAYQLREIIRATTALLKKSQRINQ